MWKFFYDVVFAGLHLLMPIEEIKVSTTDPPWMNDRLKLLIKKRQQVLLLMDLNRNRNLVNRERNRVEQSNTN